MYDQNRICELLSDSLTGAIVPVNTLPSNPTLALLLLQASAEFDSAALVANRYNQTDIYNASQNSTSSTGALIQRIVGDIAFGLLVMRRGLSTEETDALAPMYRQAQAMLRDISLGKRILNLGLDSAAGLPSKTILGLDLNLSCNAISSKHRIWGWPNTGRGGQW